VFFLGVGVALGFERPQGGDEFRARLGRLDDGVGVPSLLAVIFVFATIRSSIRNGLTNKEVI
jgi:hypothetical protein